MLISQIEAIRLDIVGNSVVLMALGEPLLSCLCDVITLLVHLPIHRGGLLIRHQMNQSPSYSSSLLRSITLRKVDLELEYAFQEGISKRHGPRSCYRETKTNLVAPSENVTEI